MFSFQHIKQYKIMEIFHFFSYCPTELATFQVLNSRMWGIGYHTRQHKCREEKIRSKDRGLRGRHGSGYWGATCNKIQALQWPMEPDDIATSCLLLPSFFSATLAPPIKCQACSNLRNLALAVYSLPGTLTPEYLSDLLPHEDSCLLRCLSEGVSWPIYIKANSTILQHSLSRIILL